MALHGEFAQTTDQSCLNRFLTDAPWEVETLNERRLEQLQQDPSTRYSDQGIIQGYRTTSAVIPRITCSR